MASFANYGAHLDVIAPTVVPGADLVFSRARDLINAGLLDVGPLAPSPSEVIR